MNKRIAQGHAMKDRKEADFNYKEHRELNAALVIKLGIFYSKC